MKKIMTAVCIITFSAVAASAQQKWGTVGDVNRFGEDAPKVNNTVENKKSSFSWALIRANIKAAQAHRDSLNKAKAEAAAKKESVLIWS